MPRTDDGYKELPYNCEDAVIHGPEKERRLRRGRDKLKYSKAFQEREREREREN